jgi:hypothetical protein
MLIWQGKPVDSANPVPLEWQNAGES